MNHQYNNLFLEVMKYRYYNIHNKKEVIDWNDFVKVWNEVKNEIF